MSEVNFLGGLADGRVFVLARTPKYLRVVHGPENREDNGYLDALDLLDDQPFESDVIMVYVRTSEAYICGRGRNAPHGHNAFYEPADGFDDLELRTTEDWHRAVMRVTGEKIDEEGVVQDAD